MRVAMLGLGLIGGSIARSLHARPDAASWSVAAWTAAGTGPAAARRAGVIDDAPATPEAAIKGADLVVLAAPVPACLAMLDRLAGPWSTALGPDTVITDVASTKGPLVARATDLGLRFVGGHPMAGSEASGFTAATDDLLTGRPWVVVPTSDEAATERVVRLATACGAHPIRMSAAAHDVAVAGISHLPLVSSVALVETVAGRDDADAAGWSEAAALAAGGWRDTTRLARGDTAMGAGILATNGPAIAARIREYVATLEAWAELLDRPDGVDRADGPDTDAIAARLAAARARLLDGDR